MNLELIHWKDHWSRSTGWLEEVDQEDYKAEPCKTAGFVVYENDEVVVMSPTVNEGAWRLEMCILKSCITERKSLGV